MVKKVRSISGLIEDQVAVWRLERKQAGETHLPPITISRDYGASGSVTGKLVAEKLNFAFWDHELVHAIAEDTGVRKDLIESLDEHTCSQINDTISAMIFGVGGTEAEYIRQISRIVHTIARHGKAVVIGRGSQYILEDDEALKVRIVADFDLRSKKIMESKSLDQKAAEKLVKNIDKERFEFHKRYYSKNPEDSTHYDLTLNNGSMDKEKMANVIVRAYKEKFSWDG